MFAYENVKLESVMMTESLDRDVPMERNHVPEPLRVAQNLYVYVILTTANPSVKAPCATW